MRGTVGALGLLQWGPRYGCRICDGFAKWTGREIDSRTLLSNQPKLKQREKNARIISKRELRKGHIRWKTVCYSSFYRKPSKKCFWAPDGNRTRNLLSDLRWDALTIELPGLRWQREGHDVYRFVCATHVLRTNRYTSRGGCCYNILCTCLYSLSTVKIKFQIRLFGLVFMK